MPTGKLESAFHNFRAEICMKKTLFIWGLFIASPGTTTLLVTFSKLILPWATTMIYLCSLFTHLLCQLRNLSLQRWSLWGSVLPCRIMATHPNHGFCQLWTAAAAEHHSMLLQYCLWLWEVVKIYKNLNSASQKIYRDTHRRRLNEGKGQIR